jgi:hypothetical protein
MTTDAVHIHRSLSSTTGAELRRERKLAALEAERVAIYGPVVRRRFFEIPRLHAVVHHQPGQSTVTLFLIRDGQPVIEPQSFREPVEALLESRKIVASMMAESMR